MEVELVTIATRLVGGDGGTAERKYNSLSSSLHVHHLQFLTELKSISKLTASIPSHSHNTVRAAVALSSPTELVVTHVYSPTLSPATMAMVNMFPWAPAMGFPWKFHVTRGSGLPSATHWNCTGEWRCAVCESGAWVMVGGSEGKTAGEEMIAVVGTSL